MNLLIETLYQLFANLFLFSIVVAGMAYIYYIDLENKKEEQLKIEQEEARLAKERDYERRIAYNRNLRH